MQVSFCRAQGRSHLPPSFAAILVPDEVTGSESRQSRDDEMRLPQSATLAGNLHLPLLHPEPDAVGPVKDLSSVLSSSLRRFLL